MYITCFNTLYGFIIFLRMISNFPRKRAHFLASKRARASPHILARASSHPGARFLSPWRALPRTQLYKSTHARTHARTYSFKTTKTMTSIGTLPAPQDVYPGERIPLFGFLSRSTKSHEECHFCLDSIAQNQIFTMETPCCGHTSHCRCFQKWVVLQSTHTPRCAYCRTIFPIVCFLCIEPCRPEEDTVNTRCCHTSLHKKCVRDLAYVLSRLTFNLWIECTDNHTAGATGKNFK